MNYTPHVAMHAIRQSIAFVSFRQQQQQHHHHHQQQLQLGMDFEGNITRACKWRRPYMTMLILLFLGVMMTAPSGYMLFSSPSSKCPREQHGLCGV
jgi:fatty acid desaturase